MNLKVFILCRDRPLYLWASLDSLYRNTRTTVDFILVDNGSDDPLVQEIIGAYIRRKMFSEVIRSPRNDPHILSKLMEEFGSKVGELAVYVEADVVIEKGAACWVQTMLRLMKQNPKLAMLGSQVDRSDFIDPEWAAAELGCGADEISELVKASSPERDGYIPPGALAAPHNPPARLLMLRVSALREVGLSDDYGMAMKLKENGWDCAITGDVVHRHLSLQNYFDYPEYDSLARKKFYDELLSSMKLKIT